MTLELLPVEVDTASINEPTSRVITPQVIHTYIAAAGDFHEAVRDPTLGPSSLLTICTASVCSSTRQARLYVRSEP
jgi:hypothetical protein